jgi:hypothetical protein
MKKSADMWIVWTVLTFIGAVLLYAGIREAIEIASMLKWLAS